MSTVPVPSPALDAAGLDDTQVAQRVARGQVNDIPVAPTPSVTAIVARNVLTRFNAILGTLLVLVIAVGDLRDALFGLVLVGNSGIGIFQEVRAKRALDRLAVVAAPHARVVRSGRIREVALHEVVLDDVLEVGPGEQIVVDGTVVSSDGLEVNESLLTGEAEPVSKVAGAAVLSGSFAAAGTGRYRATAVGAQAYGNALAAQAQRFSLVHSELRAGIDRILRLVTWGLVPAGGVLVVSQLRAHAGITDAISASVAGVVAMVPEGLVLLTSAAFAVAVFRLAQRKALVQELPTVETLARVDVLCLDKTGTLTEGDIVADVVEPLVRDDDIEAALGALASADPHPNATMRAVAARFPAPRWSVQDRVAFTSARGFSAATFSDHGTWLLGAPEALLSATAAVQLKERIDAYTTQGRRVLLLARGHASAALDGPRDGSEPVALLGMSDRVRSGAAETLRFFADQRVAVKVISGDNPVTVAALARRAGVHVDGVAVDATTLPADPDDLADAAMAATVFGRVAPDRKLAIVSALQGRGHVVAMTGDGVNDVLALKQADVGVAMGAGTAAARAVAQLVLLDNDFSTLPAAVAEGRRVIGNIERVAKLFVTKSVYALLLALAIGVAGWSFPFLPRHLSLIAALTIGLPGVLLALGSTTERARPGFVTRVLTASLPAGVLAALATLIGYGVARVQFDVSTAEAQTSATIVLLAVGLVVLARFAAPLTPARRTMVGAMWVLSAAVLVVPGTRAFFALDPPSVIVWLSALGLVSAVDRVLQAPTDVVVGIASALRRRWPVLRRDAMASHAPAGAEPRPGRDVRDLVTANEQQTVERKASLRWDLQEDCVNPQLEKAVAKTVAGFANSTHGGTLLLGVDDAGHVVGLADDYRSLRRPGRDGFELQLTQTVAKYLGAPAMSGVRVTFERVGGHDIAVVTVAPATQPVFTTDGGTVVFHLRTGNSTRPLEVDEAMRYASTRWPATHASRRILA